MNIISGGVDLDTKKDVIIFMLRDDNELSELLTKLAKIEVRVDGIRIITFVPENAQLTSLQKKLIEVVEGFDGMGGKETEQIADASISRLKNILNSDSEE